ncbi:MAG: hypothetical protein IT372_20360 [Polyangiaceae bacterium]|nr:hypothetical protein [Polyangiaceae bacterium]
MNDAARYTLVADGPTDRMLMPVLDWLLVQHSARPFAGHFADLRALPRPPSPLLKRRIPIALELYPCELLFVHRDAEKPDLREQRVREIDAALWEIGSCPPAVHVVPVLMSEAWLLFSEVAIRFAAGNPSGKSALDLPRPRDVESIDAKEKLYRLLKTASGLKGHRLQRFAPEGRVQRVAELIDDYSPLRNLAAFVALEQGLCRTLKQHALT